jgi:hypothetical protein
MLNRESPSPTVYSVTPGVVVVAGVVGVAAGVPAGGVAVVGVIWDGRAVAVAAAVGTMTLGIDSLAFSGGFSRSQRATAVPTRSARSDPL